MLLYLTEINENISEDILENRMSLLCSERKKKALDYKNPKDRSRSIAAGLLLQQGVEERFAKMGQKDAGKSTELVIKEYENGKPYLPAYPKLHFNISHSGNLVGCAFAEYEIGFDIQNVRSCKTELLIKKFHPNEQRYFDDLEPTVREAYFFRLWSIKEAYVKYTAKGLSAGFSSFYVDFEKQKIYDEKQHLLAEFKEILFPDNAYFGAIVAKDVGELEIIEKNIL